MSSTTRPVTTRRGALAGLAAAAAATALLVTPASTQAEAATSSNPLVRYVEELDPPLRRTEILRVPGAPAGAPKQVAVSHGGRHVAMIGADGVVYYVDLLDTEPAFVAMTDYSGAPMRAQRVALDAQRGTGLLQLVVIGGDSRMWHRTKPEGGSWSSWGEPSRVGGTYKDVSVSIDGYGNAHYAAISAYDEAVYRIRYPNGSWSDWEYLEDPSAYSPRPLTASSVSIAAVTRTDLPDRCLYDREGRQAMRSPNGGVVLSVVGRRYGVDLVYPKLLGQPFDHPHAIHPDSSRSFGSTQVVLKNRGSGVVGRILNVATDGTIYLRNADRDVFTQFFWSCNEWPDGPTDGGTLPLRVGSGGIAPHVTFFGEYATLTNE